MTVPPPGPTCERVDVYSTAAPGLRRIGKEGGDQMHHSWIRADLPSLGLSGMLIPGIPRPGGSAWVRFRDSDSELGLWFDFYVQYRTGQRVDHLALFEILRWSGLVLRTSRSRAKERKLVDRGSTDCIATSICLVPKRGYSTRSGRFRSYG
ncbi:uncharacterized protein LOC117218766 isoform X5 [Megalopta genalis]|uniref:uncharacterized protein LOC117218766 isoform X5 n=1 Tax=Megalopta genalis TaxID=115081 RepID=UPI003FD54728